MALRELRTKLTITFSIARVNMALILAVDAATGARVDQQEVRSVPEPGFGRDNAGAARLKPQKPLQLAYQHALEWYPAGSKKPIQDCVSGQAGKGRNLLFGGESGFRADAV